MKTNPLMLFTKIIAVYSDNSVKHINKKLEQMTPNLSVKAGGSLYVTNRVRA
jgi:hypothetical protein